MAGQSAHMGYLDVAVIPQPAHTSWWLCPPDEFYARAKREAFRMLSESARLVPLPRWPRADPRDDG